MSHTNTTINYESSNPIQWEKDLENSNIFERNMGNFCYSINHCPLELYSQNIEEWLIVFQKQIQIV